MTAAPPQPSLLATRRGKLTLVLLCAVGFLDFVDASIVNIALPSIRRDLGFSVQDLQWVLSGYLLTYGGFLLLGGRAADLLGRRRVLVAGTALFALSSLAAGLAAGPATLVGARLAQGLGAAMMTPAALSILTTGFSQGADRVKALGAWGAVAGLASAVGVFLGGVLSGGPGWRWVFFVNPPVCMVVLLAAFWLVSNDRRPAPLARFDTGGAVLATAGMLLLIYALVRAPDAGWSSARTTAELVGAAAVLAMFIANERRHPNPLVPLSIFRIRGLAAADGTQVVAIAGLYSMFFFITLYMQDVLRYPPIRAGAAFLPVTAGVAISAGICTRLIPRSGSRPIMVAGALTCAGGIYWLSQVPVHGSYLTDLLPGLVIMSLGVGAVFLGVQTAANAGVPPDKAGLAASLVNASFQLGGALGLAIFSAIAAARTSHLLASHAGLPDALTSGFRQALLAASTLLAAAALIALRATNTRGEPDPDAAPEPMSVLDDVT
jgi:EmrB/QacA subfamily drug resistance transporter